MRHNIISKSLTFDKLFCTPKKKLLLGSDPLWEGFKPYQHAERKNPFFREILKPFRGICNIIYGITSFIWNNPLLCAFAAICPPVMCFYWSAPIFGTFLLLMLGSIVRVSQLVWVGRECFFYNDSEDRFQRRMINECHGRLHPLTYTLVGAFQIITTPLTWLVVIPCRLLATMACRKDDAPITNKTFGRKKQVPNAMPRIRASIFCNQAKSEERTSLMINDGDILCIERPMI